MISNLYLLLVHGPVRGRDGQTFHSAVTPVDITDIARTCRTVGVGGYGIIQPDPNQRALVQRLLDHWNQVEVRKRNPTRAPALSTVFIADTIADAQQRFGAGRVVATSASAGVGTVTCGRVVEWLSQAPVYILIGTGWGLLPEPSECTDGILPALSFGGDYNHLSVRAASAMFLLQIAQAAGLSAP